MHAVVAALTSATFALIGSAVVILGMLRPVRYVRHRIEAAGFDTTRRTFNAPVDATPATETPVADDPVEVDDIDPVEVREPVTPDGGGLTESENRVWEDLTKRLDD